MTHDIVEVIDMHTQLVELQRCRDWHDGLQERFDLALKRITHDTYVFDEADLADPGRTEKMRAAVTAGYKDVTKRISACARHFAFTEEEADNAKLQQLRDDLLTSFLSYSLRTAPRNRRHSGALSKITMPQVRMVDDIDLKMRGQFALAASELNTALIMSIETDLEFLEHRMAVMERRIRDDMPTVSQAAVMGGILHQATERITTDIGDALSLNEGLSTYLGQPTLRKVLH
jgi:hypothetical protein